MVCRVITVMADFGVAYAWGRNEFGGRYLGPNIADAHSGLSDDYRVPHALHMQFAEWVRHFERNCEQAGFDWPAFHQVGISLAEKLKLALGPEFTVMYRIPSEDPDRVDHFGTVVGAKH